MPRLRVLDVEPSRLPGIVGHKTKLPKVGKVTDALNACAAAPTAVTALDDLDAVEYRLVADAELVCQAEAEPDFPGVHRQHNSEP